MMKSPTSLFRFRNAVGVILAMSALFAAVAVMGVLPATAQQTASATRAFEPTSVGAGGQVVVTIAAAGYGTAGGVTETLPQGFSYVESSLDDSQVATTGSGLQSNQVRFTLQGGYLLHLHGHGVQHARHLPILRHASGCGQERFCCRRGY